MIHTQVASIDGFEASERLLYADDWGDLHQQSIVNLIVEMMRKGTASMLGLITRNA